MGMIFRRYGAFTGGIDLPDEKDKLLSEPIAVADTPKRLLVPLSPCGGPPARPIVSGGSRVAAGDKLAEAAGLDGVDVLAPLGGRVIGISQAAIATEEGFLTSPAVELAELQDAERIVCTEAGRDWHATDPQTLLNQLASSSLTTHRHPLRPLALWARQAREARCDTLIANVVEGQPYVTADHRLLAEFGWEAVEGLAILGRAIGAERLILAVDERYTEHYRNVIEPARLHGIARVAVAHKYPAGADEVLVKVLTRRPVPAGESAVNVGVAVVGAATCLAVRQQVACGRPLTHRVVTVAGDGVARSGNYWAPLGMSCAELAGTAEGLIHGGPMTGLACPPDAVVGPATDAVLCLTQAIGPRRSGVPSPCIRCGWCAEHCPARLNVAALNDDFELGQVDHARGAGVMACVECGVCAYVCPARLPLTHRVRQLKRTWASASGRTSLGAAPR